MLTYDNALIKRRLQSVSWMLSFCLALAACSNSKTSRKQIQSRADSILMDKVNEANADSAMLAVMEIKTGRIAALSCVYKVDSSLRKHSDRLFFQPQEPGTIFRAVAILAALENGASMEDTVDLGDGEWRVSDYLVVRDPTRVSCSAKITLHDAMLQNSDIAVAKTIHRYFGVHPEKFRKSFSHMLVGQPDIRKMESSIFPGEEANIMTSIGYGFKLSPLQLLAFYSALANEGQLLIPHAGVTDLAPVPETRIGSSVNIEVVRDLLEGTTNSRYIAGLNGVTKLAGKESTYCVVFCGYFPKEKPEFSVISCFYQHRIRRDAPFEVCQKLAEGN